MRTVIPCEIIVAAVPVGIHHMIRIFRRKTSLIEATVLKTRKSRGFVAAVGESQYQKELREIVRSNGGPDPGGVRIEVFVALVPEPRNRHDPNAISIQLDGKKLAYLSREDAEEYQEVVRLLAARNSIGAARAVILGGARNKPSYGVFLDLADPDEVLDDLTSS